MPPTPPSMRFACGARGEQTITLGWPGLGPPPLDNPGSATAVRSISGFSSTAHTVRSVAEK